MTTTDQKPWTPPKIIPGGGTSGEIQHYARKLAGEMWEALSSRNFILELPTGEMVVFRKVYPKPGPYIARYWPNFVPDARKALVGLLKSDSIHPHMKDRIVDALVEDREKQLKGKAKRVMAFRDEKKFNLKHV
jgi:hypothetical protein